MDNKQNVFSSKSAFIFGLIAGVLIISAIGFVIMLGIFLSDNEKQAGTKNTPTAQAPAPTAGAKVDIKISNADHIRGNKNAPVQIIEFSDYQCPYCSRHHPTMQQIVAEYGDDVAWVYKHFPLDSIHPHARPAAEASECIAEQKGDDGFWQFTDSLFENQNSLGSNLYNQLAGEIGVDMDQFQNCVSSRKYQQKVEDDYQQGLAAGVTGTPGNFVNGTLLKGAVPFAQFKQIIDAELNK